MSEPVVMNGKPGHQRSRSKTQMNLTNGVSKSSTPATATVATNAVASTDPIPTLAPLTPTQQMNGHLNYIHTPSLTGELLRQAMSEYLRTQVCHVSLVVVLYGFNSHNRLDDEHIPLRLGKLCYACITQSELILIDKSCLNGLSLSVIPPSYEEIVRYARPGKQQMIFCVPFSVMDKLHADPTSEDGLELLIRPDAMKANPKVYPNMFIFSTVHRKIFGDNLQALYNAYAIAKQLVDDEQSKYIPRRLRISKKERDNPTFSLEEEEAKEQEKPHFTVLSTSSARNFQHIRTLEIDFGDDDDDVGSDDDDLPPEPVEWRHPAEQFFTVLPSKYTGANGNLFHRCGYIFATPQPEPSFINGRDGETEVGRWVDPADGEFTHRPCGTIRFDLPSDDQNNVPFRHRKHLEVIICPERSISSCSNLLQSRDLRGFLPGRSVGQSTLHEYLYKDRDDGEDIDFFLWTDSLGRSIAMNECRLNGTSDYCERQRLIHTKKMNVVGDKASWICFKFHVQTHHREIAIIACRRRYIPPYFDTQQDMAFILYGPWRPYNAATAASNAAAVAAKQAAAQAADQVDGSASPLPPDAVLPDSVEASTIASVDDNLMADLELMVDTLSPTVVPVPFHCGVDPTLSMVHPTYADLTMMQLRTNALLHNYSMYHWLRTRTWLSSNEHELGMFPITQFLGTSCWKLARSFANSILVRVSHREDRVVWSERMDVIVEGIGADALTGINTNTDESKTDNEIKDTSKLGADTNKQQAVDDPMDIVERMCTEFSVHERAQRAAAAPKPNANGTTPASTLTETTRAIYTGEEEWRCRVSQYLFYCVDDGLFPGALNVPRILDVIAHPESMVKPVLVSYETANKLERVVDFLLYIKRRPGKPLDLPSIWTHEKQAVGAQLTNIAERLKPTKLTRQHLDQIPAAYASLDAKSPHARAFQGRAQHYDYNPNTTLLQKLRDTSLMENFTCNEQMMVLLLDANYVEYLENSALNTSEHRDTSVLPELLTALLKKDYNTALVRAVCNKILVNQIAYDGFIHTLIAVAKDSNIHASVHAMRALAFLARTFHSQIFEHGGVAIGMYHICTAKNEELIEAALDMTLELIRNQTIHFFGQPFFIQKIVDLLRTRVGQPTRYRGTILQKTCGMILKFIQVPSFLHLCLTYRCHQELLDILRRGKVYANIMLQVTACLGQLFVNAGSQMLGIPSETAQADAVVLARSLSTFTTKQTLRVCRSLLVALQYLIRLPKRYYQRLVILRYTPAGEPKFNDPDPAFAQRVLILQHLAEEEGFEEILDQLVATATADEEYVEAKLQLSGAIQIIDGRKVVTVGEDMYGMMGQDDELLGRRDMARLCKEKARWFKQRLGFGKNAQWNTKAIWQKDLNKNYLFIPLKH